jgi:8-oxo-dGTP pyrophosphatase MutT (NUDIX family)/GNAT superfamily N-acetyltransferase
VDASELRSLIRAQVAARRPVDQRERVSIAAFIDHFDRLDQPFSETAQPVHVTASAIVVSDDGRFTVLHRHKRLNMWLQPGGHIEPGEPPWDGALREAIEETGLPAVLGSAELLHVDVHPGPRGHTHLDLRYRVTSAQVKPQPASGESQDVRWLPWRSAIVDAEPGLEGVLRALQPGQPKVRQVRGNDAADCAQVFLRSRAFSTPDVPVVHSGGELRRWMADDVINHTDMWVADLDGTVVGFMVLDAATARPGHIAWLEHLYLDPAWTGRGLGDQFVEVAKRRHPEGLQLWTFQANEPARRFFARHGFVEAELTDGRGNEEQAPDIRMVWNPHDAST